MLDRARLGTPFAMRPTLLRNTGERFEDIADQAGGWFERPILGRGLAVGDLDGDGRPDVVVNALDAPAAVLRNTSEAGHFLELGHRRSHRPAGRRCSRSRHGRRPNPGRRGGGRGQLSECLRQPVCTSALVPCRPRERIEVEWPWGQREFWTKPTRPD